jgi:hypothetical protein
MTNLIFDENCAPVARIEARERGARCYSHG